MAEPKTEPRGLYSKLAEVMAEVGYVEKRGHNDHFNYDYVTEADLVDAVREKLAARQVVMLSQATDVERVGTLTTVHMDFLFVDGESGEQHQAKWVGTGEDKGDKGLYKAYTGAIKYFLMKSFLIPTGDDPEREDKPIAADHRRTRQEQDYGVSDESVQRAAGLRARIRDLGVKDEAHMKLTSLGRERLEQLTEDEAWQFEKFLNDQADKLAAA